MRERFRFFLSSPDAGAAFFAVLKIAHSESDHRVFIIKRNHHSLLGSFGALGGLGRSLASGGGRSLLSGGSGLRRHCRLSLVFDWKLRSVGGGGRGCGWEQELKGMETNPTPYIVLHVGFLCVTHVTRTPTTPRCLLVLYAYTDIEPHFHAACRCLK